MKYVQSGGKTVTGPADWFTGTVLVDSVQSPGESSTLSCAHVRFTPGARTVWHTHPRGQTLYHRWHRLCRHPRRPGAGDPAGRRRVYRRARSTGTAQRRTASCRTSRSTRPTKRARL
jgi:hypothetical protein